MTVGRAILTLLFAASAVSAARSQTVQVDSASGVPVIDILTRMVEESWHPQLNDPLWLDLRPSLEAAFDSRLPGVVSVLARRAAARVDVAADPVVSVNAPASTLLLDTRPWFELATPLPYFVEIHATLDDAAPILIAAAFSGHQCGARIIDIGWPLEIGMGFHRIAISIDVAYLEGMPANATNNCAFSTRGRTQQDWPQPGSARVVAIDHRPLPGIAFAMIDTQPRVQSLYAPHSGWTSDEEASDDVFISAAKSVAASTLDPRLEDISLEHWLNRAALSRDRPSYPAHRIEWMTDFCDEDEALAWHPGVADMYAEPQYWRHDAHQEAHYRRASTDARRRPREICVTAAAPLPGGRGIMGIRIAVASVLEDLGVWQLIPPRLYEAFLDAMANSLAVTALGDLPGVLAAPEESWPQPDISVTADDIVTDPTVPVPGQQVTVRVTLHNIGDRDMAFVNGDLTIIPCCDDTKRVHHAFLGAVPAGGVLTVERNVRLPTGGAGVSVNVWPFPPDGRKDAGIRIRPLSDRNGWDNAVETWVGARR